MRQNSDVSAGGHHRNGEFARLMRECRINQATLAEQIDVHPNSVSRWATGSAAVPGPVMAYLRVLRILVGIVDESRG